MFQDGNISPCVKQCGATFGPPNTVQQTPTSGPHLPSSSFSTCGLYKWERDGMLKVSRSQQLLSTSALCLLLLVLLPHVLLQGLYKLPAKPDRSVSCQVCTGNHRLCFSGFPLLEALFYLTVGNLLLTKVVRMSRFLECQSHNTALPPLSVTEMVGDISPHI